MTATKLGPYTVLRPLRQGGQGRLSLALRRSNASVQNLDPGQQRDPANHPADLVVIKRLRVSQQSDPELCQSLVDEGALLARLNHPNIVRLLAQESQAEAPYLVLEYVEGLDLQALVSSRGPLTPWLATWITQQLCAALQALHQCQDDQGRSLGLLHRDLTPANVLLGRAGEVKLCDLGNADWRYRQRRTRSYQVRGTARYLCPEQVRGENLEPSSDLYTLGLLLFFMLDGGDFNDASSAPEVLTRAANPVWRTPRQADRCPPKLLALLQRSLRPEPERRYVSAAVMYQALGQILQHAPENAWPRALRELLP